MVILLVGDAAPSCLVWSLSLVSRSVWVRRGVRNGYPSVWGVRTATMSVCERLSHERDIVTGAGNEMDGGNDMVMELGSEGMAEPRSKLAVIVWLGRRQGGVS